MSQKPRLLFASEFSALSTGYARIYDAIIRRFHAMDKYEIAEMGNYGHENDPRAKSLPWKFYGVLPKNEQEQQIYNPKEPNPNHFGAYKIEGVLADFQPDIVFSILDPWMMQHLQNNRFRKNYKLVLMPTVDSAPQRKEWCENLFKKADAITTYSEFAKRTLEKEGVKVVAVTSPSADNELFKPMNKSEVRKKWCLSEKNLIIGTVMRNQKRKLFPELFQAYASLRQKYKNVEEVQRSVLLCHTTWPDIGWDLPELINRAGIQRHTIFTYKCRACKETFLSWFIPTQHAQAPARCVCCGKDAAFMPATHDGIDSKELAEIYNLMDIYVHPAICEGWGMPVSESKACGIPGLYQNYSALEDHVKNGGGRPIPIAYMFTEAETMAVRSYPKVEALTEEMYKLLTNRNDRIKLGKEARKCAEKFSWDYMTKQLDEVFSGLDKLDRKNTWDVSPSLKRPQQVDINPNLPPQMFLTSCYRNILGREPDEQGFNNWMVAIQQGKNRKEIVEYFLNVANSDNSFEAARWKNSLEYRGIKNFAINIETDLLQAQVV